MNKYIYRQADSRWAKLPYPVAAYSFGGNGCGACSVLHCIIEMAKYSKWTPANVQPYMKQFATYGNGTTWAGITEALKYYGLKDVKTVAAMSQLWPELSKGGRAGVLLMGSKRGPDGTIWTTGGHYIAYTDYKYENSKHWFYIKDSGFRHHDGWWCYEKSLKGDVVQVWVGVIPTAKEVKKPFSASLKKTGYSKTLPTAVLSRTKGGQAQVKRWQTFLNWWYGYKLTVDGVFGNATEMATTDFQYVNGLVVDGSVGTQTLNKAKEYLKKEEPKEEKPFQEEVIDVSYVQNKSIDWAAVKKAGISGAIIRCGYRGYGSGKLQEDTQLSTHLSGVKAAGLKIGLYFFTEAINAAEGKEEAKYVLDLIKKYKISLAYPIAIDTENINASNPTPRANSTQLSKTKRTEAIKAFCEEIKAAGYEPMIYASTSWLNNQLDMSKLPYTVWVAQYADKNTYKGTYALWQFTSSAQINGITGRVDQSHCYVKYTTKKYKEPTQTKKTVAEIAKEVLDGKWGTGEERKKKLEAAGYNYEEVQKEVNRLLQ